MRSADRVAVFLPCRAGSTRVPHKNTRPFAGNRQGLLGVKLAQLEQLTGVDVVILDSNDPEVIEIGRERMVGWRGAARLEVRERPDRLGQSSTTTDELVRYAVSSVDAEVLLWTHVTSPLCGADVYHRALGAFASRDAEQFDSLMSVTPLHAFLWSAKAPLNYEPDPVRWPQTQTLDPVFEVNSAVFIVPMDVARRRGDRIGDRPELWPMSRLEGLDVDWEEDFALAEQAFLLSRTGGHAARSER